MSVSVSISAVLVSSLLAACGPEASIVLGGEEATASTSALSERAGRRVRSVALAGLEQLPAGIAGGRDVLFVGSPLEGRVLVLARDDGRPLGELPPPSGGFVLPFIMHAAVPDRVVVLDSGGLPTPAPFVPAIPTLYEYRYTFGPRGFRASLERTISFAGLPFGFAEDFAVLEDGGYAVTDAVFGAIWLVDRDGAIAPGIAPERFDFTAGIPTLAMCGEMPVVSVGGLPFLFSGSTIPGVATIVERRGRLYFYSPCAGTLFSVPLASLRDGRTPWARAADLEVVSVKPSDVPVEELIGFSVDAFDRRDPFIYAADALQLRLLRIDSRTGRREVLGDDPRLFNFPSSTALLPPSRGRGRRGLMVVSNQQHRLRLTNDAIAADVPEPPFLVTEVELGH